MINDPVPVLLRGSLVFVGSALAILGYEYLYHKKYEGSQPPLLLVYSVLFAVLAFRISSFAIGASIAACVTGGVSRFVVTVGGLLGLWVSAIGIQLGQNGVRLLLGKPTTEVSFIRKDAFRVRRHHKYKSSK